MKIRIKRAYETPEPEDGVRILVERLWPRGLSKKDAHVDMWLKEIAPSTELRKWYSHDPAKWEEFRKRYFQELDKNREAVKKLLDVIKGKTATFVYSSREKELNSAHALKDYIEKHSGS
ncbi:MAG TPA: DUF488 family protein [Thermodesulfobacteriota bacterium]|nr:DUF488 family protein [Thermodesulfobacteriota bacterium]